MNLQLNISGYFDMKVFYLNGQEVKDENEKKEIAEKLQSSDYLIGMESRIITSLKNLDKVLYLFTISPTDSVDYEFEI